MTETAQAKTAKLGNCNWGISLKIREPPAQAKSLIRLSGIDIKRQHLEEKKKSFHEY